MKKMEQTTFEMGDSGVVEGGINIQTVLVTPKMMMEEVTRDDCAPDGNIGDYNCVSMITPSEEDKQLHVKDLIMTTFDDCEEDGEYIKGGGALVTIDMKNDDVKNVDVKAPTENECVWGVRGVVQDTQNVWSKVYYNF